MVSELLDIDVTERNLNSYLTRYTKLTQNESELNV